ncbi:class I SAM-dependent methyltransferase [Alicyclobacillus sp. ALC3]|uniref:class I SAM-dependent methyltransferase n=1 Tax=Alicyclobacillus sp. ALC3 TaxID=2796143 RepID=UPI002379CDC6|nr:class I SAM-dependent methyltransferase [Alicyclobacillus sp. ALC3]WDL99230.1 class I SAM-dependent methyltransferase [Alicyclobacillus sp. ALC3]
MDTYWNHNTAFHEELVADAKNRGGRVLDVGCGDGLLLQRLAPFVEQVVGIDPDPEAIVHARQRLSAVSNVSLVVGDFLTMPVPSQEELFSSVICVATLHHMAPRSALLKMRQVLAPGGRLLIVGLAAEKSIMDVVVVGLLALPIRVVDRIHGGMKDPDVRIVDPKESLREIRQVAHEVIPEAVIRRRFYYRYLLSWDKPKGISE